MKKTRIQVIQSPQKYFRDLTIQAARDSSQQYASFVLEYISDLLSEVIKADIKQPNEDFVAAQMSLYLIKSLEKSLAKQLEVSKKIGDLSLLTSGLFSDSTTQKLLDLEYFIVMGKMGYAHARTVSGDPSETRVFDLLSHEFVRYMAILHRVAISINLISDSNILNIYEKWLQTQSPSLKKLLVSHGIPIGDIPDPKKLN